MALTPPPSAPPAAPTAPGDAPSRAVPSTFRALADAFVVWQIGFRNSLADLRTWLAGYITWAATHVDEMNALQSGVAGVADDLPSINAVAADLTNVNLVAGDLANINIAAGNTTNINAVAANNANVSAVGGISANVTTVAGIASNVTTVAGAAANVSTVAGSVANVNTVAGIAANVTTVAGASVNVGTVAGSIANVNTVGSNISSVNQALAANRIFTTTAKALSKGVASYASLVAGSGGTNGTFDLAFSGGAGSGAAGRFTVAGGALVSILITTPGDSYTSAPTISFAASTGLTGASAAAVIADNVADGAYFYVPIGATGQSLGLYQRSGASANSIASLPAVLVHEAQMAWARHQRDLNDSTVAAGNLAAENKQRRSLMNLRSVGTLNADGTITVPAGDYIMSQNYAAGGSQNYWPGDAYDPALFWDLWVAAADPTVVANLTLTVRGLFPTTIANGIALNYTQTEVAPGVYKLRFRNSDDGVTSRTAFSFFIKNNGASAIKIFPPFLTLTALTAPPVFDTFVDQVAVAQPRVWRRDWYEVAGTDIAERRKSLKRINTALALGGSDANPGTLYSPKATLGALGAQIAANTVVGLQRGGLWREVLPLKNSSASVNGIEIQDVAGTTDSVALPKITPFDQAVNGTFVNNGDGTYSYTWTAAAGVANNGYENVWVLEINTATEAVTPIASTNRMTVLGSQAAVAAAAGSVFIQSLGSNQWKATIRPTDSLAPGAGSYRYEVVARYAAWEATSGGGYGRDLLVSGLHLVAGSFGYGIAFPERSVVDRCVIEQASTHGSVQRGGIMQRSLHYGMGDDDSIGHVLYTDDGSNKNWVLRDGWSINVGPDGFYSHTPGTSTALDWQSGLIENYVWTLPRQSNGALFGQAVGAGNNKRVDMRNVYIDGRRNAYELQNPTLVTASATNILMRRVGGFYPSKASTDSFMYAENISDPANANNRNLTGVTVTWAGSSTRRHTIHAKYVDQGNGIVDNNFMVVRPKVNSLAQHDFSNNLVVCDITGEFQMTAFTAGNQPVGATRDFNCYVLVNASAFKGNPSLAGNVQYTFALYQAATGWDTNSLFIDLRNDPRGVKALWVDPANGDYRYAQTEVARKVAAYCATNRVGCPWTISEWPTNATVDEQYRRLAAA